MKREWMLASMIAATVAGCALDETHYPPAPIVTGSTGTSTSSSTTTTTTTTTSATSTGGGGGSGGSSGCVLWSGGNTLDMRPGEACVGCHTAQKGVPLAVAGTVYVEGDTANGCVPASADQALLAAASVVISDAAGLTVTIPVDASGNFAVLTGDLTAALVFPITAKVKAGGKERAMVAAQSTGDCNTCHSAQGAHGAPGRIKLP